MAWIILMKSLLLLFYAFHSCLGIDTCQISYSLYEDCSNGCCLDYELDYGEDADTPIYYKCCDVTLELDSTIAGVIAGCVVGGIFAAVLIAVVVFLCHRNVNRKRTQRGTVVHPTVTYNTQTASNSTGYYNNHHVYGNHQVGMTGPQPPPYHMDANSAPVYPAQPVYLAPPSYPDHPTYSQEHAYPAQQEPSAPPLV